ncbi:TIGR02186 family protein [Pseudooceanicola aestuarii]|uniref:TIGR02186 family protein n=1 Tax=Pseudooceanicola aestuarii TaxID=2697319 RepID=UPI0013D443BF|nr:TIGR02186 family protein [Pseudooceanicola aestuarii]
MALRILLLLVFTLCRPLWAAAEEEAVLGLSQNRVAITANFDGSEILIFGAVRRESPILDEPLGVIITLEGPHRALRVHRKERRAGIWVNADNVTIYQAPSFYAIATSAPVEDILSATENLRHRITIPKAVRSITSAETVTDEDQFLEALIRIRSKSASYQMLESQVQVDRQTLFRTAITLPANLTEGTYSARVHLTRDRRVVNTYETAINVNKVGLERWLFNLSQQQPFLYGLLSLAIAIAAGWLASAAFRMLRS